MNLSTDNSAGLRFVQSLVWTGLGFALAISVVLLTGFLVPLLALALALAGLTVSIVYVVSRKSREARHKAIAVGVLLGSLLAIINWIPSYGLAPADPVSEIEHGPVESLEGHSNRPAATGGLGDQSS